MIGQVIRSHPRPPVGAILWFLVAAGVAALAAVARKNPWIPPILALFPLGISLAFLATQQRPVAITFTKDAIEVEEPAQRIPYDSIEGIRAKRPGDPDQPAQLHYPIRIIHAEGTLHLPPRLSIPSDDIFQTVLKMFPVSGSYKVDPKLADYRQQQVDTFGSDRVFSYRARSRLGEPAPSAAVAVCVATIVVGIIWLVIGLVTKQEGWGIAGVSTVIGAALLTPLLWTINRGREVTRPFKGWQRSSLVISPLGIALVQGEVEGEMRWDELKSLRFGSSRKKGFQVSAEGTEYGITLGFEGANLTILDVYDRPVQLIYRQIKLYWRGG